MAGWFGYPTLRELLSVELGVGDLLTILSSPNCGFFWAVSVSNLKLQLRQNSNICLKISINCGFAMALCAISKHIQLVTVTVRLKRTWGYGCCPFSVASINSNFFKPFPRKFMLKTCMLKGPPKLAVNTCTNKAMQSISLGPF